MKKQAIIFLLLSFVAISDLSAKNVKLGSHFSLQHDGFDRYIDGFDLCLSTALAAHLDLFLNAGFHKWSTGVERNSPSQADESVYNQSTYLVGLSYYFTTKSVVMPYMHVMLENEYNKIEEQVTTFSPPDFGVLKISSSTIKENSSEVGLGFGFCFPVIKNLYYDMSVTFRAVTRSYSDTVLSIGFFYKLGF